MVLLFVCTAAQAQDTAVAGLSLSSTLERLVESREPDGTVRLVLGDDEDAVDVEQFVYSVRFTNAMAEAAEAVRITSPVPPGLHYVAGSAVGPGSIVLFSVDGGSTFGAVNELMVLDGESAPRRAEAADYTHVRWILQTPLDAGATGFVRFRAVSR